MFEISAWNLCSSLLLGKPDWERQCKAASSNLDRFGYEGVVPFTPAHQREQAVSLAARSYHPDTHTPRSHSHHVPSRASGNSIPLLHLRNKQIPSHSRRFHFHRFVRLHCRQRCHWHQGAPRWKATQTLRRWWDIRRRSWTDVAEFVGRLGSLDLCRLPLGGSFLKLPTSMSCVIPWWKPDENIPNMMARASVRIE